MLRICLCLVLTCSSVRAEDLDAISAATMQRDVKILASDRFEGRGPGTRGEELTIDYLAKELQKAGAKPAGEKGTYYQTVPLFKITTKPESTLVALKGDRRIPFRIEEEFAGTVQTQSELEDIDAEAIFVGHGITAPAYDWDDYKDVDVKGKIVVLFTNEPPSDDPKYFGGKALTYFGRWSFKFEEAARRGAKACLIIHTNETAGYPYSVVKRLDGAQLERNATEPTLQFAGWLSRGAGEKLLSEIGMTVDEAVKAADTKGFKPIPLGLRLKGHFPTAVEKITSKNVVGMIEGSDPKLMDEAIVFTAHWDHLGVGKATLGDAIHNGAADNATGCAILLELARKWNQLNPKPKRSALFLAVTAEEKGLLGSKYYARHPIIPLGKTALNLNFDMILPLGIPESIVLNGAERTTIWPELQSAAQAHQLTIEPDPRAAAGTYFRSDHFSMARAGVPAFSVSAGSKLKGLSADTFAKAMKKFNEQEYHTPQDEFREDWDFRGFVLLTRFAVDVATRVANADALPTWNAGDEFLPARIKSGVK